MHDTVTPFIETMGTAINRQEAAMPVRKASNGYGTSFTYVNLTITGVVLRP
jgi:hypothetical protein